jgi:hypothetical protein
MIPALWMVLGSTAAWLAVALLQPVMAVEVLAGIAGPLLAAAATYIVIERGARVSAARVTALLMAGFWLKFVFFGFYVVAALRLARLETIPFVVSFTAAFVTLYGVEAVLLQRLFLRAPAAPFRS